MKDVGRRGFVGGLGDAGRRRGVAHGGESLLSLRHIVMSLHRRVETHERVYLVGATIITNLPRVSIKTNDDTIHI